MPRINENQSNANNSNITLTPGSEKANSILFGLTPKKIYYDIFGYYYDNERICSVALTEMFEYCQEGNEKDENVSYELSLSRSIFIAVELDKAREIYRQFKEGHDNRDNELSNYGEDDETALNLHERLIGIVDKVEEMGGIYAFNEGIADSIRYIQTKQAYEDMVTAAFCITSIYIAYKQNCFDLHKPAATINLYGKGVY
jgi:hypothetical protein